MNISSIKSRVVGFLRSSFLPALGRLAEATSFVQARICDAQKDAMSFLEAMEAGTGGVREVPDFDLPMDADKMSGWVSEERERVYQEMKATFWPSSATDGRIRTDLFISAGDAVWSRVLAKYGDKATYAMHAKMAEELGVVIQAENAHSPGFVAKALDKETGLDHELGCEFDTAVWDAGIFGKDHGDN